MLGRAGPAVEVAVRQGGDGIAVGHGRGSEIAATRAQVVAHNPRAQLLHQAQKSKVIQHRADEDEAGSLRLSSLNFS